MSVRADTWSGQTKTAGFPSRGCITADYSQLVPPQPFISFPLLSLNTGTDKVNSLFAETAAVVMNLFEVAGSHFAYRRRLYCPRCCCWNRIQTQSARFLPSTSRAVGRCCRFPGCIQWWRSHRRYEMKKETRSTKELNEGLNLDGTLTPVVSLLGLYNQDWLKSSWESTNQSQESESLKPWKNKKKPNLSMKVLRWSFSYYWLTIISKLSKSICVSSLNCVFFYCCDRNLMTTLLVDKLHTVSVEITSALFPTMHCGTESILYCMWL